MRKMMVVLVVLVVALPLAAQMNGGGMMGQAGGMRRAIGNSPITGMFSANMLQLPVAADGTVFVIKLNPTAGGYEVQAIRPSGVVAWSYPIASQKTASLLIAGNALVLTTSTAATPAGSMGPIQQVGSTLTGLSVVSGSQLWKTTISGVAMAITPYGDGLYVLAVDMPVGADQPSVWMSRRLIGIGNDGVVKFTMNLD